MPTSAGLLMFRTMPGELQVLLVHPGGPFFAKKDAGVWSIPKGMPGAGEDLLDCAKREFGEETGFDPGGGPFLPLGTATQKGGKVVHAWAVQGDCDPARLKSNTFKVQWPPKSGAWKTFPEIDRARWFSTSEALGKVIPAQIPLIERLQQLL